MKINYSIIRALTKTGNLPLLKYFSIIKKDDIKRFPIGEIYSSVKLGNYELVIYILEHERIYINNKILFKQEGIDINYKTV